MGSRRRQEAETDPEKGKATVLGGGAAEGSALQQEKSREEELVVSIPPLSLSRLLVARGNETNEPITYTTFHAGQSSYRNHSY